MAENSQNYEDGEILKRMNDIIGNADIMTKNSPEKVLDFLHPREMEEAFDFGLNEEGLKNLDEFEELVNKVMRYSVKTTHARFYNQFYSRMDEAGLAAAWLLEALNTNIHTYECAPVLVTMELRMVQNIIKLFGWAEGDGIFAPGGSICNYYGMEMGRYWKYPNIKKEGLFNTKPLAIMTSDMCHYSMQKGASLLGIGEDNVYHVKSDANGKMRGEALRSAIMQARSEGKEPFFVNATAGTTVFGAFDPLDEIADVCQEEGLWLHVDGCWGGAVVMSPNTRHLIKGIERVDSISWNTHKMLGVPLQCTVFLVRHKGLLASCNSIRASYLFQPDKYYDTNYDTGDKSFQCGRKGDVLKLWLMIKFRGMKDFGNRIDTAYAASKYLETSIRKREGFRLVLDQHDWTNICFWYIPPSMRGLREEEEWKKKIHKVAPTIKKRIVDAGTLMVAYQPIPSKNLPNFFRMIITCFPTKTNDDMDFLLDEIEKYGNDL